MLCLKLFFFQHLFLWLQCTKDICCCMMVTCFCNSTVPSVLPNISIIPRPRIRPTQFRSASIFRAQNWIIKLKFKCPSLKHNHCELFLQLSSILAPFLLQISSFSSSIGFDSNFQIRMHEIHLVSFSLNGM